MITWRNSISIEFDQVSRYFYVRGKVTLPFDSEQVRATDRQISAVKSFYEFEFPEITQRQAHTLICCREYARLCTEALLKGKFAQIKRSFAQSLSILIGTDEELRGFATQWCERNFEKQISSPRVRGTIHFQEMEDFHAFLWQQFDRHRVDPKDANILVFISHF